MTNNTTYQELIEDSQENNKTTEEYLATQTKVKENIAEYTHSHPQTINITPETHTIDIDTSTHQPILTLKNLQKLSTYLGVDDLIIYKPTQDTLLIDYQQDRPEEEEYYLWQK